MISIDKKVLKTVSKLTSDYSQRVYYKSGADRFVLVHGAADPEIAAAVRVPPSEIPASIRRLTAAGYLKSSSLGSDYYFVVTPKLVHRKAFWLDDFTKKFWGGFVTGLISGILATVLGGLLLAYLRARWGI